MVFLYGQPWSEASYKLESYRGNYLQIVQVTTDLIVRNKLTTNKLGNKGMVAPNKTYISETW